MGWREVSDAFDDAASHKAAPAPLSTRSYDYKKFTASKLTHRFTTKTLDENRKNEL